MIAVKIYIYFFFGKLKIWKIEILDNWKIGNFFKFQNLLKMSIENTYFQNLINSRHSVRLYKYIKLKI